MHKNKKKITTELLAPAGSFESLNAAAAGGADAVYFGLGHLNMRSGNTPSVDEKNLNTMIQKAHDAGMKAYGALNTVVYNQEIDLVKKNLDDFKNHDGNAVIAADPAVMNEAAKRQIRIHLSTQTSVSNTESVRFYAPWTDRIVLARELTITQIQNIIRDIQKEQIKGPSGNLIEIEVFCHGAMCVAISGRCWMSLYQYNKSANRGQCLQACRRGYKVTDLETDEELEINGKYVMSPRDMNTLGFIDVFLESGVKSLKIEGRARGPEYVIRVVKAYREALTAVEEGTYTESLVKKLNKKIEPVYNRGYSSGYYLGEEENIWSGRYGSQATHRKIYFGKVLHYYSNIRVAEILVEALTVSEGEHIILTGKTTGIYEFTLKNALYKNKPVKTLRQQMTVTVSVTQKVRKNDRLYVLRKIGT